MRVARTVVIPAFLFFWLISAHGAHAQMFQCPPPSVPISGGGGMECQCPDGSLAGLYTGCPSQAPPPPACPAGMQLCGDMCCGAGNYCSRYGCTPNGALECGNHYCNPGQQCSRSGGCQPAGSVDCGEYYCQAGQRCGSNHRACLNPGDVDCSGYSCPAGNKCSTAGCIPQDAADCGNKTFCKDGLKCSRDGKRCLTQDAVDCGSHSCGPGQKCGSSNSCLAHDAVDCGGGRSCAAGNKCASGNKCIPTNYADCGNGSSCGSEQKCSRGGGCIPKQNVDCGGGISCPSGRTCGSNKQCLAAGEIDCNNGTSCSAGNKCSPNGCIPKTAVACPGGGYCDAGKLCIGEGNNRQCLTPKEAKEFQQAEARRKIEEAAAAKQAQAEAQRIAEEERKAQRSAGIGSSRTADVRQSIKAWNTLRMRGARPLPLPEIDGDTFRRIPAQPRAANIPSVIVNPENERGPRGTGPSYTIPLKWAGKLFFTTPESDKVCSAQFITPRVVLTAAHCVRDASSGKFYDNIVFALQYQNGDYSERYGVSCVTTPDKWVGQTPANFPWDYALILTSESLTGHFGWETSWDGAATTADKIGYPVEIASGQVVQVDEGPVTMAVNGAILALNHGNPHSTGGGSGGAWVAHYSAGGSKDSNIVISVTSFIQTAQPQIAYGPYLTNDFNRMLEYVKDGCP